MEISDAQYEHLVGMLADNRVAIVNAKNDLLLAIGKVKEDFGISHTLIHESLKVLGEDVTKVQGTLRDHGRSLAAHSQAIDGLVQLCKSTFDAAESANKRVLGESSTLRHDESEKSHGAPQ